MNAMKWMAQRARGDGFVWAIVILLSIFSILAVYSSTSTLAYQQRSGNMEYYVFKHIILMLFGFGLMYAAHRINARYYSRIAQILLWLSIPLLLLTYALGVNVNDSVRWLSLPGTGITFQSSDLAKLALLMYMARALSRNQDIISNFKKSTLPLVGIVSLVCILIGRDNLSTGLLLFTSCLMLMFIGRVPIKHLMLIGGVGLLLLALTISILSLMPKSVGRVDTWVSRIENFASSDEGNATYQNVQANIAISRGGIIGVGPGASLQKNFLPNSYNDFIFAIIIEEYGFAGALALIAIYLALAWRAIRILMVAPHAFSALLAAGLTFSLVFQAFINMAVSVNLLPVTGLSLPLVSMGGTSLIFTSIAFGIILSVSRQIEVTPLSHKTELSLA